MLWLKLVWALSGLAYAAAAPREYSPQNLSTELVERDNDAFSLLGGTIKSLVDGLKRADCEHMAKIGMAYQGVNSRSSSGGIWLGKNGPNTLRFRNEAGSSAILVVWDAPKGDYESSFMSKRRPKITYSLAAGSEVQVSAGNGVSGAWAVLYGGRTKLTKYGQVDETWGEFTTGADATADVSWNVNTYGSKMTIRVQGSGCVSDADRCSFHCKSGDTCGESGTYKLKNCEAGSQKGASIGYPDGINPEGGCKGWSNGGHLDVSLGK